MAQKTFTQIHITVAPIKTTDVPTQSELTDVGISDKTSIGTPARDLPIFSQNTGSATSGDEKKPAPAPVYMEPQFPGGAAAWAHFLSRNLQAPDGLEAGDKKTVIVKFWVSENGSVTQFDVVQSGGAAYDAEVVRVLKKMPKWKPALRNGQPAAVSFTQPVTFVTMGD